MKLPNRNRCSSNQILIMVLLSKRSRNEVSRDVSGGQCLMRDSRLL